ncbi:hypothetical protein HYQ46_013207 [Verticillium longisporum]|nr:hypothetical protein HYQ46_013207 [Verticillium longisporum]
MCKSGKSRRSVSGKRKGRRSVRSDWRRAGGRLASSRSISVVSSDAVETSVLAHASLEIGQEASVEVILYFAEKGAVDIRDVCEKLSLKRGQHI